MHQPLTAQPPVTYASPLRYEALDSLRGVCACMVLLFHIEGQGWLTNLPPVRGSWMFVDFFFVLSGFVIYASYGDRLKAGFPIFRYMILRTGRIYPLHLAVLLAYLLLELIVLAMPGLLERQPFSGPKSVDSLINNLLFLQIFGLDRGVSWNTPAWSIAAEFWAYVVTALIFRFAGRLFLPVLAAMIIGSLAWLFLSPDYLGLTWNWSIFRCFYGFGLGMLAYELHRSCRIEWLPIGGKANTAIEFFMIAGVLTIVSVAGSGPMTLLAPPVFFASILIFARERGYVSKLLRTAPMRLLGVLSYSIYMIHVFVLGRMLEGLQITGGQFGFTWVEMQANGSKVLLLSPLYADLFALVFLVTTIGSAWISYHLIEAPARAWSRKIAANLYR